METTVVTLNVHGLFLRPRANHPDGNARLLHGRRRGIELCFLNVIVPTIIVERLAAPQAGKNVQSFVEQLGARLAIGDFAKFLELAGCVTPPKG
jgi:hypothetical protein